MDLRYITINVGYKKFDNDKIFNLAGLSKKVEFAIPGNYTIMFTDHEWHDRISGFLRIAANIKNPPNIAFHMEKDWCVSFCCGAISKDLSEWFNMKNKKTCEPVIKRWQLSYGFPIKDDEKDDKKRNIYPQKIARLIKRNPGREYIFGYGNNDEFKKKIVTELYDMDVPFSLIYHNYGGGMFTQATKWAEPIMKNRSQGYSGALTPGNISLNLADIASAVPNDFGTWVDSRGIVLDGTTGELNFERSKAFIKNVLIWENNNKTK